MLEGEKKKLISIGRQDLAAKVQLVSETELDLGFDVLSFKPCGEEIHIEVKSTQRYPDTDSGFWVSENERRLAESDSQWRLYRVWSVHNDPVYNDLGNIFTKYGSEWQVEPGSWFIRYVPHAA